MDITDIKRELQQIALLTSKGIEILAELRRVIEQDISSPAFALSDESTPTSLQIRFAGITIIIRVELGFNKGNGTLATVAAYLVESEGIHSDLNIRGGSAHGRKVTAVHCVPYDKLGNINHRQTKEEFGKPFLTALFAALYSGNLILRP